MVFLSPRSLPSVRRGIADVKTGAWEVAPWLLALVDLAEELGSIPSTLMVAYNHP